MSCGEAGRADLGGGICCRSPKVSPLWRKRGVATHTSRRVTVCSGDCGSRGEFGPYPLLEICHQHKQSGKARVLFAASVVIFIKKKLSENAPRLRVLWAQGGRGWPRSASGARLEAGGKRRTQVDAEKRSRSFPGLTPACTYPPRGSGRGSDHACGVGREGCLGFLPLSHTGVGGRSPAGPHLAGDPEATHPRPRCPLRDCPRARAGRPSAAWQEEPQWRRETGSR